MQADHVRGLLQELEERSKHQAQIEELQQALEERDREIANLKNRIENNRNSEDRMQISGDQFLIEKCVDFIKEVNQGLNDYGPPPEGMLNI